MLTVRSGRRTGSPVRLICICLIFCSSDDFTCCMTALSGATVALMAGGVGERIFPVPDTSDALPGQAPQVSFRRVPAHALHTDQKVMMPSGAGGGRAVTRPFQASTFEIQHHGQIVIFCTSSRRATRSMWRCFSSSLRTPPAARKAVRQSSASFRRPAPAHFFPALPVQWP